MTKTEAIALDKVDPLGHKRDAFFIPEDTIYLDGNSLGVLPKAVPERIAQVVHEEWGTDLIRSWNKNHWMDLPLRVGAKIARLIGAKPNQVVAADSTSINLFKVILAALKLRPDRKVIISDIDNFPTDLYVAQGINELLGNGYELRFVSKDKIENAIDNDLAVMMLTQVDYRTGYLYDLPKLTQRAHTHGGLVIWDLAHSAGALPVELDEYNVDFAVGCGYKYLNGGPGAPAFLYVNQKLHSLSVPFVSGWMGHNAPFEFRPDYEPAPDIRRLTVGTPSVLGMSALDTALDVFADVDMKQLRVKSLALTELFMEQMAPLAAKYNFKLVTPKDKQRGSQVSYAHPDGYAIVQALIEAKVIGDFRAPNIMRFGFTPLYIGYADVVESVERLEKIMASGLWKEERFATKSKVT